MSFPCIFVFYLSHKIDSLALTRYHEIWEPERAKVIAPMADMLNHAAEPNCQIDVDYEGNVNVVALYDVPAGEALTVSYADPTNPTPRKWNSFYY